MSYKIGIMLPHQFGDIELDWQIICCCANLQFLCKENLQMD